jgi:hypothetical protein
MPEQYSCPNFLIIAGTGRKAGKTYLAAKIIKKISKENEIIAIKICPHRHHLSENLKIILNNEFYDIIEETSSLSNKDTARFIEAGASKVFYLQTTDKYLYDAFTALKNFIPENNPVIVESGGLRKILKPGLFFIVNFTEKTSIKPSVMEIAGLADRWIEFDGDKPDFDINSLSFERNIWTINNK